MQVTPQGDTVRIDLSAVDVQPDAGRDEALSDVRIALRHLAVAQALLHGGHARPTAEQSLASVRDGLRAAEQALRQQLAGEVRPEPVSGGPDEAMAAALPTAILTTDRHGAILRANGPALRLLDLGQTRLQHKPLFAFIDPQRRRTARRQLSTCITTGRATDMRLALRLRDGRTIWCHAWLTPHRDENPDLPGSRIAAVRWVLEPEDSATGEAAAHAALVELCRLGVVDADLRSMLARIATLTANALPGADDVSIALGDPDSPALVVASSARAQATDGLQMLTGQGPTSEAYRTGRSVLVHELATDPRWPELSARSGETTVRGLLALPIAGLGEQEESTGGVFTLYGSAIGALDTAFERDAARPFVAAVEKLVKDSGLVADLVATRDQLREALTSRAVIDQAKGIVMAVRKCDADEAFRHLRRLSNTTNRKLRTVAQELVDGVRPDDG